MIDYMKNMLIGLFVVVACGLIVGIILFIEPSVGDAKQSLIVRFSNINGLSVGTRVMFAGKPVGEIISIEQIPHAREQPTDERGQVYFYQLALTIDSSVRVYNTDEITVQTSGLLGEKSIAIIPKSPPRGVKPTLINSSVPIYAESIDPLESALSELSQLSDKVEETLDKVVAWIDQNGHELGAAIRSFDDTMNEASKALAQVNQLGLLDDVKWSVQNFSTAMQKVHQTIDQLNEESAFTNLAATLKNVQSASTTISEGKGSIGKLLMSDDSYLQVNAILSKVDTLMNDVNHYGVLFHLNKQWQRTRQKEAAFLNALDSPGAFRSYFNKEVDLINASMSRLSMLVSRAEESPEKDKIFDTIQFKKDFAELLRRTETLSNNLRLYNQQLSQEGAP